MQQIVDIRLQPKKANDASQIRSKLAKHLKVESAEIEHFRVIRRSVDARRRPVHYLLRIEVWVNETFRPSDAQRPVLGNIADAQEIGVIGAGPAGLFAALELIRLGFKPIIFERGKRVKERRRDLARLCKEHIVDPDSNYCFGEGGAGTYSDGKLYTRSHKRGKIASVLESFVDHGAPDDILIDAHPHIGTNLLPTVITNISDTITKSGGELHFNSKVVDFIVEDQQLKAIKTVDGVFHKCKAFILATGHSARNIYELLFNKGIRLETKPFAIGFRVEHPQDFIDRNQYHCDVRDPFLPPASYRLVSNSGNRGIYSFCMCPGGIVAPCATEAREIVTNGWSPSKRNNPFANSGIVVQLHSEDWSAFTKFGPLAGLQLQKSIEQLAWKLAGQTQCAPAQRLTDFIEEKVSSSLPKNSYLPGTASVDLNRLFPRQISQALKKGLLEFDKKIKSFVAHEAIAIAPETRSSSPVRIPRNPLTFEHIEIEDLYPCGEGAGYAGGIVSAALDGIRTAQKCVKKISSGINEKS